MDRQTADWFEYADACGIIDEAEVTEVVVCGERAYRVPKDIADELRRLRQGWAKLLTAVTIRVL